MSLLENPLQTECSEDKPASLPKAAPEESTKMDAEPSLPAPASGSGRALPGGETLPSNKKPAVTINLDWPGEALELVGAASAT